MHRWAHNSGLQSFFKFSETFGLTPKEICDAVGIDFAKATSADALLPAGQLVDAVEWCALRSGRADFGLLFGAYLNHRVIGLTALLIERARSLAEFFEVLRRNLPLQNGGYAYAFNSTPTGGEARLVIHSQGQYSPVQWAEMNMTAAIHLLRHLIGGGWNPVLVSFAHPRGAEMSDYQRILKAPVNFDTGFNAIHFSAEDLAWRAALPGAVMQQRLDAEQNFALISEHDIVRRVGQIIRALLPGEVTLDAVAGELGLTPRTLQRRLTDEDTRFTSLVKAARVALARDYLRHPGVTVADASERVGFSHASELSRLLRSELGVSPAELKAKRASRRAPA